MPKPNCIDCNEREQFARQLCSRCRSRRLAAGQDLPTGTRNRQTWEQVVADVTRGRTADDCWPWAKHVSPDGYAVGGSQFGTTSALKAMHLHLVGDDLTGKRLERTCHESDPDCVAGPNCPHRRCVNPVHARVVDVADQTPREGAELCVDCGEREQRSRQLCDRCGARYRKNGWPLPEGERTYQRWEEVTEDVRRGRSDDECWPWRRTLTEQGYGLGGYSRFGTTLAHRAMYIHFTGEDITGYELDHLCHNADPDCLGGPTCLHRRCCNPRHLEKVSGIQNLDRRKPEVFAAVGQRRAAEQAQRTHCKHGHPYDEGNTYWFRGKRLCRTCRAISARKHADKHIGRAS